MNISRDYDRQVVAGIAAFAQERGDWGVYLDDDPKAKVPEMRAWRGDGMIADMADADIVHAVTRLNTPAVIVGGLVAENRGGRRLPRPTPCVVTDNQAIGRLGAEHLISCGLERFAYCGVPRTPYNAWAQARGESFAERLSEAGLSCGWYVGRHRTARRWTDLLTSLSSWLETLRPPVGVMACDDTRARQVLEACRRLGLRVPQEVAVLGVDNDPLVCEMSVPPLSSIQQDAQGIGYRAAAILEGLMSGRKKYPALTLVPPSRVVTRQSTDFVAASDPMVASALRYVRENAANPSLDVRAVAQYVGASRSSLDGHLRHRIGRSTHREIERVRIETVKRLLESTALPLHAIARRAGYRSENYLGFAFRRVIGTTPGRYRERVARRRA